MAKKDLSITVRNLTVEQYDFLEKKAKREGLNISAIIKIMINDVIAKGKANG